MSEPTRWDLHRLCWLGWLGAPQASGMLEHALAQYQRFHGLRQTGDLDHATRESLREVRFCALPDVLEARAEARWRKTRLTYRLSGTLPGLSDQQRRDATALALSWWSEIADLSFAVAADGTADITMGAGRIDGPGGTLAWSELPSGSDRPLQQKYDDGEQWVISEQMSGNRVDLARVVCHEVGHALGLGHLGAGTLMAPTVSQAIRKPQRGDVEALLALGYAPARPGPTPPPVPPADKVTITLSGALPAGTYTLQRAS